MAGNNGANQYGSGNEGYGGNNAGQYGGQYGGNYTGQYEGQYGGNDGGQYGGQYGGNYTGQYGGQYGGNDGGQYGGQYGGNYTGQYGGQYGGNDAGQYGGQYGGSYAGPYNGGPDGYYAGYDGNYGGAPGAGGPGTGKGRKKSRAGDIISLILMAVALCVFLFAGYTLYGYYKEYKKADDEYSSLADSYDDTGDESEDLAVLEDADTQTALNRETRLVMLDGQTVTLPVMTNPINFEELKAINSDIVGWIKIRALDLSYPVVQGEDNDYYLHNSFEQEYLFSGCIFMNYANSADFTDRNTIIYGHNMKDGSMFGTLKNFHNEETYEKSKYFWIFTEDFIYQYRIFSARVVNKTGMTYQVAFTDEEFEELLTTSMENSEVDNSDIQVTTDDKLVTLSTCTGDDSTRFVVVGKLVQTYASRE